MTPGPVPYIDGEGGKPNYPPYGEDFFQRIVGVHWPKRGVEAFISNPIFVTGGFGSNVQHIIAIQMGKEHPVHGTTGENPVFADGVMNASSGRLFGDVSIMLQGGSAGPASYSDGVIAASVNGADWTQVARFHDPDSFFGPDFNDTYILGLVYDEANSGFYACGVNHKYRQNPISHGIEVTQYETLYSSGNGLSWSFAGRRQIWDSEGDPPPPTNGDPELFLPHCNNIPHLQDGVFGNYKLISPVNGEVIESFLAVPSSPPKIDIRSPTSGVFCTPNPSIDVQYYRRGHDGEDFSGRVSAPFPVNAVAYVGGVLVATGGSTDMTAGQTVVSFNQGRSWEASFGPEEFAFWTVCGGFRGKQPP